MKSFSGIAVLAIVTGGVNAATFTPGDVFATNSEGDIHNITAGGSFSSRPQFADVGSSGVGHMAWSADLTTMYAISSNERAVYAITTDSRATRFATGLSGPISLLRTADGRLLVTEYTSGEVTDITAGGDFTNAPAFASGLSHPIDLTQATNGMIYVSEIDSAEISNITPGGAIGPAHVFAKAMYSVYSLIPTGDGVLAAMAGEGATIVSISSTGTKTTFATNKSIRGMAYTPGGRLIATSATINGSAIYDITAGGNLANAPVFANLSNVVNVSVVPIPEPASLAILVTAAGRLLARRARP